MTDGYDTAAEAYAQWLTTDVIDPARERYLEAFADLLEAGANVLELGCGGGGPTTRALATRFELTGVDISARQIELARRAIPRATFVHADMSAFEATPASFDGVAAFYSLIHLPFGELPPMLLRIATWLRDGGVFTASLGARDEGEHVEPAWLGGAPMYWSGYEVDQTIAYIEAAELTVIEAQVETAVEDGEDAPFLWVIARKTNRN